jgi:hypothetical protein
MLALTTSCTRSMASVPLVIYSLPRLGISRTLVPGSDSSACHPCRQYFRPSLPLVKPIPTRSLWSSLRGKSSSPSTPARPSLNPQPSCRILSRTITFHTLNAPLGRPHKDYANDAYRKHVKHRLAELRLRDFRTVHGQRIIAGISKDNLELSHKTLLRIKSFLSGVFRHAKTEGIVDYENPMRDVRLPANVRRKKFRGDVYTMKEIWTSWRTSEPTGLRSLWWLRPRSQAYG